MFPKVHLRIILTLGTWILLAPKLIKINGKRSSLFCQENLLTNLRREFHSVNFKERGPRVPDKYPSGTGCTSDTWQGSTTEMLTWGDIVQAKKGSYKWFLTERGLSALNRETHHPGHNTRLYSTQNGIQKWEPYSDINNSCACWPCCPSAAGGYCFLFKCLVTAVTPPPLGFCRLCFCHCWPTDSLYILNRNSQGGSL